MTFKPTPKPNKEVLNITIDKNLMDMLKEVMRVFEVNLSTATSEVLDHFYTEVLQGDISKIEDLEMEEDNNQENKEMKSTQIQEVEG